MSLLQALDKSFYRSVKLPLLAAKVMGFMPIEGLFKINGTTTRGTWRSPYILYYIFNITLRILVCLLVIVNMIATSRRHINNYHAQLEVLITFLCLILAVYFSIFSKNWRNMLNRIEKIEKLIPHNTRRKAIRVNRVVYFMFFLGTFEHIMYIIYNITALCGPAEDCSVQKYFEFYYDFTFNFLPFEYGIAFILQLSKFQRAFLITFLDPMIVSVALYLMNRFKDFNYVLSARLKKCHRYKNMQWTDIQAYYTRLNNLVEVVDSNYNTFIFLSFSFNLIFWCKNIYLLIQHQRHPGVETIHRWKWFALLYYIIYNVNIVTKALILFTTTAYLHTLTREPLNALHKLPSLAYSEQFQRFMDQVFQSRVHLTGLKMFNISRNTILSVISTVITYVLVLIQLPEAQENQK